MSQLSQPPKTQYLLLSDVHLGADLGKHKQPWETGQHSRARLLDRHLAALLDHYREQAEPGWYWTLVIAGDLVDFVGMSIIPDQKSVLQTPLSEEELIHGLGNAVDHAVHKMHEVARHHDLVFRKLAQFISAGHHLVLVRGNHDVEFYWQPVRRAFVDALLERTDLGDDLESQKRFESRIEFNDWFYYIEGELYVEHGHQYDETCSYLHALAPLSPLDPRRLIYSFSDVLQRYIVGPTQGISTCGHENMTLMHYLRLAFSMGFVGCATLGYRFMRAVIRLFAAWRAYFSANAQKVRAKHEMRMQQIARHFRLKEELLHSVASLWAMPVTRRISAIIHILYLDVIFAAFGMTVLLLSLVFLDIAPLWLLPLLAMVGMLGLTTWIKRGRVLNPVSALKEGACRVAKLLPACFVVMGHTHAPAMEAIDEGVTYVNLGQWSTLVMDGDTPQAPCSHLVIRHVDGKLEAEFISVSLPEDEDNAESTETV